MRRAADPGIVVSGLPLAACIQPALDLLTQGNAHAYRVSESLPSIYDPLARVRYRREPRVLTGQGPEQFDGVRIVLARRWGDCDDLAPARAGEILAMGFPARAVAVTAGNAVHVVVETPWGIEDPSLYLMQRESINGG